ncbi:MAG TPA: protein kinase, partial [Gemmataceae bacterium]|nr:protein kinase [Gemmataceae bacterium]
ARLHHPGIVQIYDVGEVEGCPYLALEYLAGGSLADWLDGTPQPLEGTVTLLEAVARAVHFAHQHQVIHRDLKPANILLQGSGVRAQGSGIRGQGSVLAPGPWPLIPKISDFGLAKRLDGGGSPTQSGEMLGTPSYMAPEQANTGPAPERPGQAVGPPTDVYALGAILYEMLTGRPPFKGATPIDTVLQVLHQEPVRPSSLRPGLPRDLETICLKCLDKDPRRRYATAEQLANDLHCFRRGQPIQARPIGRVERLGKWARRRPAQALLLLAVISVTVLGFAGVTWQWLSAEAAREREADQRHRARAALYFSRIIQSQLYLRANDVAGAAASLARCMPQEDQEDRRGWEWYYLEGQLHRDLWTLPHAHPGTSGNVVFSADGSRVAAIVDGLADDATGSSAVRLWDAHTGAMLASFTGPTGAHRLLLHPDGRRLILAGTDGAVVVMDSGTGKELLHCQPHERAISALALRPGGQQVASASWDGTVKVWDLDTGRVRRTLPGHTDRIQSLAWHPDGTRLAFGSWDRLVRIWDLASDRVITLKGHKSPVYCTSFSPDGKLLVSAGSNGNFRLWNLAHGFNNPAVQSVTASGGALLAVTFSPDSRYLAYGSTDATVRVWDIESGVESMLFRGQRAPVESVAFSPDGAALVSFSPGEGAVKLWDLTRHPEYSNFAWTRTDVEAMVPDPDRQHVHCVTVGGQLQTWDTRSGALVAEHAVPLDTDVSSPGVLAAFEPSGQMLAGRSRTDPRQVRLWSTATGQEIRTLGPHQAAVRCLKFAPDGRHLATGAGDSRKAGKPHEIKIWDITSGVELLALKGQGRILNLAFSPNGSYLAAAGQNGELSVVRLADRQWFSPPENRPGAVTAVAFSPDGQLLASATTGDSMIKVWQLSEQNGRLHWRLLDSLAAPGFLGDLAFSPNGSRLAGISRDMVKMWEVATGHEVLTLRGAPQRYWDPPFNPRVAFSADGNQLIATNWNESMSIWHASPRVDPVSVATRQAKRRQAAEDRAVPWHLREAQ